MPPKKKATKAVKSPVKSARSSTGRASATKVAKAEVARQELVAWLNANDSHLDTTSPPITISQLFSDKISRHTYQLPGGGDPTPYSYDWSALRQVLEARDHTSPRWFIQIREEDLLLEPDGLVGVTVECVVIAEAQAPTLAPAHYVVKEHWPYSDVEDNAPEQIMEIEKLNMVWHRMARDDGTDINAYLLQERRSKIGAEMFGFGSSSPFTPSSATASGSSTAVPSTFGFASAPATDAPIPFSVGFAVPASGDVSATAKTAPPPNFTFGFGASAPAVGAGGDTKAAGAVPSTFSFGFGAAPAPAASADGGPSAAAALTCGTTPTKMKPHDICFVLWSKARLRDMRKELKSGSRIVIEDFLLANGKSIKLVMQNDQHDDVEETVRNVLMKRVFAKTCDEVRGVDDWIEACPVFDAQLMEALQEFRSKHLASTADNSQEFANLLQQCHDGIFKKLTDVTATRRTCVERQLEAISDILHLMDAKKLAEKHSFRLLKYYANNDRLRFRPFGKISGISEMGEMVDVCQPPAYVPKNPFLAAR